MSQSPFKMKYDPAVAARIAVQTRFLQLRAERDRLAKLLTIIVRHQGGVRVGLDALVNLPDGAGFTGVIDEVNRDWLFEYKPPEEMPPAAEPQESVH